MFLFTIPAEAVDSKKQSIIFDKYIFDIYLNATTTNTHIRILTMPKIYCRMSSCRYGTQQHSTVLQENQWHGYLR